MAHLSIHHHASKVGTWEMVRRSALGGELSGIRQITTYSETATAFHQRRELPRAQTVLILNLGAEIRIVDGGGETLDLGPGQGFVGGLHDRYALSQTSGSQEGLQVDLTPLGLHQLFGVPMSELTNRVLRLEDLLTDYGERRVHRLADHLASTSNLSERHSLFERFLVEQQRTRPRTLLDDGVQWAWNQLQRSSGQLAIGSLARELGWSPKRLILRFREQLGLPPKQIARLLRFEKALAQVKAARAPDWSSLAVDCGYYDQAHLIREFHSFAGVAPNELVRQRLPDGGGFVSDS